MGIAKAHNIVFRTQRSMGFFILRVFGGSSDGERADL